MFVFDEDTAVERVSEGVWETAVGDRWRLGDTPNGGYLMGLVGRAIVEAVPHPDPLAATAYFVRRSVMGPARVEVEVIKQGRRHSIAQARLLQGDGEVLRMTATLGDLASAGGPSAVTVRAPEPEGADLVTPGDPGEREISRRFDYRLTGESAGFAVGAPSGRAVIEGLVRFSDGREPDPLSLLVFPDALPPAVWNIRPPAWVPTLEMTVHIRGIPAPGWLSARMETRALQNGYLEEDGLFWDSTGALVAMSRQLALMVDEGR
jgi:acyl-CoA thioesterase